MQEKYKIADSIGHGFLFGGKEFTQAQAQRIADKWAKRKNDIDFQGKRDFWRGVVCLTDPAITLRDCTYFRLSIAGQYEKGKEKS